MPRGLPRSYIKKAARQGGSWSQIFKRAWRLYKGSKVHRAVAGGGSHKGKKGRRGSRRPSSNPRKGRLRRLVRRYRRRRRGSSHSLQRTMFKLIRMGALAAPGIDAALRSDLDTRGKLITAFYRYTGYNLETSKWEWQGLAQGWTPFVGACLLTYALPKLVNIIRRL